MQSCLLIYVLIAYFPFSRLLLGHPIRLSVFPTAHIMEPDLGSFDESDVEDFPIPLQYHHTDLDEFSSWLCERENLSNANSVSLRRENICVLEALALSLCFPNFEFAVSPFPRTCFDFYFSGSGRRRDWYRQTDRDREKVILNLLYPFPFLPIRL